MEEGQQELRTTIRQQQEKFVYYIIALCVTAIGFSVFTTKEEPLELIQIPLGIAVLCWGLSIYKGIHFIKLTISTLSSNHDY